MKHRISYIFIALSILISITACGDVDEKKFGVCSTEQDAMNMMIASQVHGQRLQKIFFSAKKDYENAYDTNKQRKLKSSEEDKKVKKLEQKMYQASTKWTNYTTETSKLTRKINAQKYQQACDNYRDIAKKYDFDIESASKTTVTMAQLEKDGAKKGGVCNVSEATVALHLLTKDAIKTGNFKDPVIMNLIQSGGLDVIQNPNRLCEKVKKAADKLGVSYIELMQKTAYHLKKGKNDLSERVKIRKANEKHNKKCSVNDAIELSYKQEDYSDKFTSLYEKWKNRISSIRDAKIYNSERRKLADIKRKEVDSARSDFFDEFKQKVRYDAADKGKYDLACDNYAELIKKYEKVLINLKEAYVDFHNNKQQQVAVNTSSGSQNNPVSTGSSSTGSYTSSEKYNAMVDVINKFSPKIHSSFRTYTKSCGTDKDTRQKTLFTNIAGRKIKLPNSYAVIAYYEGYYKESALKTLNEALASKTMSHVDNAINAYKTSVENFTKLFSEASEYYKMKDYADDDFKKGDQMHAPIMAAYDSFIKADQGIRKIVEEISDKNALQQINAYKAKNEHLFYFVEKAQYLAKKFYRYANNTEDYMTLSADETHKRYQTLRDHYKEFKAFKLKNEVIFKDNTEYKYYLGKFSDYLVASKEFYLRVKSKKRFDDGEEDFLKNLPEPARAIFLSNQKGSRSQLLKSYNALVSAYNELNM